MVAALNKVKRADRNNVISKALRTSCAKTSIPINGKFVKATDLAKVFEAASEAEGKVALLRAQYLAAVEASRALEAEAKTLVVPIKNYVMAAFGERGDVTASFGFEPRKVSRVSNATRSEAIEKTLATRAARHTMGTRQRAAVHGSIDSSAAPSASLPPAAVTSSPPALAMNGTASGPTTPLALGPNDGRSH